MPSNEPFSVASFMLGAPGLAPRQVWIDRRTLTLGRHPRNDIVLDDPTVSDEHAIVHTSGALNIIHDLGSRNGTRVNGRLVRQCVLCNGDVIDIGVYRLAYAAARPVRPAHPSGGARGAGTNHPGHPAHAKAARAARAAQNAEHARRAVGTRSAGDAPVAPAMPASLDVLSGLDAGREIALDRPINRVGGSGMQLAVVAHRRSGWAITHLEGPGSPLVNGAPIGLNVHPLVDGDLVELADAMLRFRLGR